MKFLHHPKKGMIWTRESLFSRLPQALRLGVRYHSLRGHFNCRRRSSSGAFLTLDGLELNRKSFFLPLGLKVQLEFALPEGWGQLEGEVVGWSACVDGSEVMLKCEPQGRVYQRRLHLRQEAKLPVQVSETLVEGGGETRNLSNKGMCIFFPKALPEGRLLDLELFPYSAASIKLKGEVVWQEPGEAFGAGYLAGLSIEPISTQQRNRHRALLGRLRRSGPTQGGGG